MFNERGTIRLEWKDVVGLRLLERKKFVVALVILGSGPRDHTAFEVNTAGVTTLASARYRFVQSARRHEKHASEANPIKKQQLHH
jgi:hypothetical protein